MLMMPSEAIVPNYELMSHPPPTVVLLMSHSTATGHQTSTRRKEGGGWILQRVNYELL